MTVLLVEDDPVAIAVTDRGFSNAPPGSSLHIVTDGIEASRYIAGTDEFADRAAHPLPDLILLDISLPRLGGFQFLRWLREKAPEQVRLLPVMIITSSTFKTDLEWARALGVQDMLVKPVKWREFWSELRLPALS